ncbi:unnamed protein product [Echinostoma caproni]|uniref:RRM domain-containing protein n=1 Tax=Echinostoma caproni TaxID=27848 RepID=A0A183AGM7_9TREM|nr:unnamed protein product [Echinostoma caproni]
MKGFNISTAKPGRTALKKLEDENKKKVNIGNIRWFILGTEVETSSSGRFYKPTSKYEEKQTKSEQSSGESKKQVTEKPMTEQQLCEAFGRYGPLASVKIMWPRTEEERSRGKNCGFVAFMNRKDGERALENIRGKEILGFEMKLGWGKSVPIPLYPVYIPPTLLELIKAPPPSGLPFNAQPREWLKSVRQVIKERAKLITDGTDPDATVPPGPDRKPFDINKMSEQELQEVLKDAVVKVVIPSDRSILALIHRLIEFVVLEGPQFEAAIMHREQNNPQYKYAFSSAFYMLNLRFLFDYQSSEHTYYRWKLWSILHGESVNKWRTEEFRMFEGGPLWRPPPMNLFSGGMPEDLVEEDDYPYAPGYIPPPDAKRRDADGTYDDTYSEAMAASRRCGLTEAQRGRFGQMLLDLEPCRANVGDVMVWCLEHADSASDIADCIVESLSPDGASSIASEKPGTDAESEAVVEAENTSNKSPVPITKSLARLFLISDILYNSSAKVPNASFFRKCFEARLPDAFKSLHIHYRNAEGKLKAEQLKVDDEAELAGIPLGPEIAMSDVSGNKLMTLDTDVEILDGQPLVQYDGDPLDVDGSPLSDDAIQETNLSTSRSKAVPSTDSKITSDSNDTSRLFVPSKWETVDPEVVESEAVTTTSRWELLVDPATQPSGKQTDEKPGRNAAHFGRWTEEPPDTADDDDLDGQPLTGLTGLVAYDDAVSSASSDDDNPPPPKGAVIPPILSLKPADSSRGNPSTPTNSLSEERRAQLREIELKVLKYQDELEASRKGDATITEQAISKQIQRYRERLLERLNEDDMGSPLSKQSAKSSKTKSNKNNQSSHSPNHTSSSKRRQEHSRDRSDSPLVRRDQRDRSPPRSFRDRDRTRRRPPISPSSPSDLGFDGMYASPARGERRDDMDESGRESTRRPRSNTWESEEDPSDYRFRNRRTTDELEEGEASDEEDCSSVHAGNQRTPSKRKSNENEGERSSNSPRTTRKRRRSRSPNPSPSSRHSRRSGTPSPDRKRTTHSDSSGSRHRRR